MQADRSVVIGVDLIEEFYWHGDLVVYVNHQASDLTYDEAIAKSQSQMKAEEIA